MDKEQKRVNLLVQKILFENQDKVFADFQAKLIPTVARDTIIGVRTPVLRKLAKEFSKTEESKLFIKTLPHQYFEENNLHGFIIEAIKNFDEAILAVKDFLPIVDNWATCDIVSPKIFKKNPQKLLPYIKTWINSDKTFTIRFGIETLMAIYLDENFLPEYLDLVANIRSEEYYVNMMIAWYFATALAKQYDSTIPYIQKKRLDDWSHNKTIQKAIESYRITNEQKQYLRSLKVAKK